MEGSVINSNLFSFNGNLFWYSNFLWESRLMSKIRFDLLGFLALSEIKGLMYPLLGWIVVEPV